MKEGQKRGSGGLPMFILIGISSVFAWVFANPFVGFFIVMGIGLVVLAVYEHVQGRKNPPRPDDTAME